MAEAAGGPRYPVTTNVQTTYLVAINFDDHVITFIPCQTDLSTWELKPSQYLQKLSSSRFLVCQAWEPNVPKWKKIALTFIAFNSEILAYAEKFGDFWQHSYTSIRQSLNSWLCSGFVTDWTHCLCKTIAYTEKSASSTFSHAVQDCNSIREHRTTQQLCGLSSACGLLTPSSVHFSGVNWLRSDHTSSNWGLFYCFHRAIFTQVLNSVLFPSSEYMNIRKEHLSVEVCLREPLAYWVAVQLYYDWHWETKKNWQTKKALFAFAFAILGFSWSLGAPFGKPIGTGPEAHEDFHCQMHIWRKMKQKVLLNWEKQTHDKTWLKSTVSSIALSVKGR